MRMKVNFSCNRILIFLHIESNFSGTFLSFAFLTTIALSITHYSESTVVHQNSCCYSVIKYIGFCEGAMLFTMENVY